MARIVPKLNLNKTPELVDNNSLVFAKNIRFNANGLSSDYGFDKVSVEHLAHGELDWFEPNEKIVGVIPYNTAFYLFVHNPNIGSYIYYYDELTKANYQVLCNWNWSGGKIDGVVNINLNGDVLITVAEYDVPNGVLVPLKTINLSESTIDDDETIYTQAPNIPLININCTERYKNSIPSGTYQFFVRYEIRKDFYTNWMPASKELFAGYKTHLLTNQGELTFAKTDSGQMSDSDDSFILTVDKLVDVKGFKSFQLGFIISHDSEVYARAYKHYDLDTTRIYFDYDTEYIEELDVRDLLEPIYSLYNVGNVTNYKNKLYISNYIESDFNPNQQGIQDFISNIDIELDTALDETLNTTLAGNPVTVSQETIGGSSIDLITEIVINENTKTVGSIISEFIKNNKQNVDTRANIDVKYHGIKVKFTCTAEPIDPSSVINPGGGENLDPDDNPIIIPTRKEYSVVGTTIKSEDFNEVIDTYLGNNGINVAGIKINNGKIIDNNNHIIDFTINYISGNARSDTYYNVNIDITFSIFLGDINISSVSTTEYTLIPYQGYDFYVHFVRSNGEITNGHRINSDTIIVPEYPRVNGIPPAIYPKFIFKRSLPNDYVACFISFVHSQYKVAQLFDIHEIYTVGSGLSEISKVAGDCLELDTQLYSALDNIECIATVNNVEKHYLVDYKASYDNTNLITFGSSGKCLFNSNSQDSVSIDSNTRKGTPRYAFIRIKYDANERYTQLIKCTPFIVPSDIDVENAIYYTYDKYNELNLGGYLCKVSKLKDNTTNYVSGSDIYDKTNTVDSNGNISISLTPISEIADNTEIVDADEVIINYTNYHTSEKHIIYSNFNLNYICLRNTISPRIHTDKTGGNDKSAIYLITDSSQLSEIYELKSEYYEYTRRTYLPFDNYNLITFNNTIRSSVLEGDESKVNMFKFKATDYYNVPTDKGIIINLVAVGDNILVHTQDSIYKFSGQNSLTAAGGEDVQMKESEPFDTGIQELFGSEFGYAGLANKEHQILSEFGYTFWDRDSGRIYLYTGNAQMKVLSDDISKLLRRASISNIHLADDYYNNRIFICIEFNTDTNAKQIATLSYDFVTKSFISVHDFAFDWHFKTKAKCYFISNEHDVYRVGTDLGTYGPFLISQNENLSDVYPNHGTEDCIVDVIFNDRFEVIKTLNTVQWTCNKIEGFDTQINMAEETFTVESHEKRYKGDYLRFYSDSCMTDKLNIQTRSNDERLRDSLDPFTIKPKVDSYTQPRYNLGKWTFNYFRNILNRTKNPTAPRRLAQEDTLLYGKYFVARFVFNRTIDFKFEDVSFFTSSENNV